MKLVIKKLIISSLLLFISLFTINSAQALPSKHGANFMSAKQRVARWAPTIRREAQYLLGPTAPVAVYLAQIGQESGGDETVTAWDNGRGLVQFMDGTVAQIVKIFPELGMGANPYDPTWAVKAQVRFDYWLYKRVKGKNECEKWGALLKGYNAGLGYPQRAQKKSDKPDVWFGYTEYIPNGQSSKNFEYSRMYPRWILFKRQPDFITLGNGVCLPYVPVDINPFIVPLNIDVKQAVNNDKVQK